MSSLIIGWPGAVSAGAAVAGGKGWNLGRLHRYGFAVPAGGVLVAESYRRFMAQPVLQELRAPLADVPAEAVHAPGIQAQLAELQAAIRQAALPPEATADVQAFLMGAGLDQTPVAVRSSATAEDGATASFAGIHESFLNCRGLEAVLEGIKGCYASLWSPQAVAYRRRQGLTDDQVACAVVICAMVAAPGQAAPQSAGVAFSCDPLTGRRDLTVISSAPGSGAAVVGGSVNPEELTLVTADGRQRVETRRGRPDQVLSDEQALALAQLVKRVEWALGDGQDPQDVEWAYDGSRFWLLQARPITRLPYRTFAEVAHLPAIWSNGNSKDAAPMVMTTFSWDYMQELLRHIFFAPYVMTGFAVPPGLEIARRFSGRMYFDMTGHLWAGYDAMGVPPADMNMVTGGYQPEIPVPPGDPLKGPAGRLRQRRRQKMLWLGLHFSGRLARISERSRREARRLLALDLTSLSDGELWVRMAEAWQLVLAVSPELHLGNILFGTWPQPLRAILARVAPGRETALTAGLMADSGAVTSAEQGYRMYDLARAAEQDPAARAYLAAEPLDPQGWRNLPADSPFRAELERFLAEFGHRAVYEAELATPRWHEDPTYLLQQTRALLAAGQTRRPTRAGTMRAAAEAEVARRTFWLLPLIHWLASRARMASGDREACKSTLVCACEPLRTIVLEVGRRMAERGLLEQPDDVFYLSRADMAEYLTGNWDGAGGRQLVADRREQQAAWQQETPADVFIPDADGFPAPAGTAACACGGGAGSLTGVGVAAGTATGPARIIRHPSEGHLLKPGEVLVAPSTDPGWTPLFSRASAVVMEVGGYLSHGAIVAREYGIPAVVNIPGLLQRVQDGQILWVDGDRGEVMM